MKNIISAFFLLLILLCCAACGDNYDSGTRHTSELGHDYQGTQKEEDPHSRLQDKYQDTEFKNIEGANRWIWQKPNLIIQKLEPLEGKVVADIGAGPYGYFSLRIAHQAEVEKVIAIDIAPLAVKFMDKARELLPTEIQERFETRLVKSNDPQLEKGEADIVLIVNTASYFEDRIDYLKRLRKGIAAGGKLVIVDFKKRNTPVGPDISERVALGQMENDLRRAGYQQIDSDDRTLEYQYIVTAMADKVMVD